MLTHFSLFTGIGGLDLAAEWAGFKTVGQCEWADYPTKILEKNWPDVPRWRDIRSLTYENFREQTGLGTVDIISGGFPCQPFSVAGKQKGKDDDRYLWPEMLRVIRELAPSWVIGENVPGILQIAADDVCKDLEREGYEVGIFNFEAAAVGARHRRERFFFVANCNRKGLQRSEKTGNTCEGWQNSVKFSAGCGNVNTITDAEGRTSREGLQGIQQGQGSGFRSDNGQIRFVDGWWDIEPNVGRVAHGIPNRVDRLKCLGNAVVPQQAYPIFKAIAEIERSFMNENNSID